MKTVRIVGCGATRVGRLNRSATDLAIESIHLALNDAGIAQSDLQGLIAVPSMSNPHFMQAHYLATMAGLLPAKKMIVRTIDTGGAGAISALATAAHMIRQEWCETAIIVASDAVLSLEDKEFSSRADASVQGSGLPSPSIPNGYDLIAQWTMNTHGVTREQLAMVPVLMSHFAARHPGAMCKKPYSLDEVLASRPIGKVTNLLECARRADGAAAVILSSSKHWQRNYAKPLAQCPVVISTGEGSGPLFPPEIEKITEQMFSCEGAAKFALESAHLGVNNIDFFGLYDCFPICFLRALEAIGVCAKGEAGQFVERKYQQLLHNDGDLHPNDFPFNTHGGLMGFGAPWEVPAMYNILEAVAQLKGEAEVRQISPKPQRALVYGNGGIFSASSVAILGDGKYDRRVS
jgi:acetyl-CoA acetyltransferase